MYRQALQIDARHADTLCSYALLLEQEREDVSGAEKLYRRALDASPDHVAAMYQYGMMLDDKGKYDAAEMLYRRVLQVDPKHTDCYCRLK